MTETQCDVNTLWWRKHTVMTETHCDDGNTLWWWKHTVMTETHCDDGNTLWWQKHTVMTETHCDDGNKLLINFPLWHSEFQYIFRWAKIVISPLTHSLSKKSRFLKNIHINRIKVRNNERFLFELDLKEEFWHYKTFLLLICYIFNKDENVH